MVNILPGTIHHSLVKDKSLAPPEMLFKCDFGEVIMYSVCCGLGK